MLRDERPHRIHLLDISEQGARVHCQGRVCEVGDRVMITCVLSLGRAQVMWARGLLFGVQFTVPLTQTTIGSVVDAEQR